MEYHQEQHAHVGGTQLLCGTTTAGGGGEEPAGSSKGHMHVRVRRCVASAVSPHNVTRRPCMPADLVHERRLVAALALQSRLLADEWQLRAVGCGWLHRLCDGAAAHTISVTLGSGWDARVCVQVRACVRVCARACVRADFTPSMTARPRTRANLHP